MIPPLIVRADAHAAIGSGHVMRCLALAHSWQDRGGAVTFVGRLDDATLRRLQGERCRVVSVAEVHPDPGDLATTIATIEDAGRPLVAIDGYAFDVQFLEALRSVAARTLVLDDMAALDAYPCDVVLNPNFATEDDYSGKTAARVLAGPAYAMLRRDVALGASASASRRRPGDGPLRVLLTFGGSDPADVSRRAIEATGFLPAGSLRARCLIGPSHPRGDAVRSLAAAHGVEVLSAVRDMAEQLAWADVAVTAAGSTSWELAAFGVPSFCVVVAENQRRIALGMEARGAARFLGDAHDLTRERIADALREACSGAERITAMAAAASRVVDGRGAARVADALAGAPPDAGG